MVLMSAAEEFFQGLRDDRRDRAARRAGVLAHPRREPAPPAHGGHRALLPARDPARPAPAGRGAPPRPPPRAGTPASPKGRNGFLGGGRAPPPWGGPGPATPQRPGLHPPGPQQRADQGENSLVADAFLNRLHQS